MKPINVLCLSPFVSKTLCDDAFMFIELHKKGTELVVISSKSPGVRGRWSVPDYINMDGVRVHRLYKDITEMFIFPMKSLKKSLEIAKSLNPRLIFCSHEQNMRLALLLQKHLQIPIVLRVEVASGIFNGWCYRSLRLRCIMQLMGIPPGGPRFWSWLCKRADTLITCDPKDQQLLGMLAMHGKPVYLLQWPANIMVGVETNEKDRKKYGIYAGSLHPTKNLHIFERVIPRILDETPTGKFIIVGSGALMDLMERLKREFPEKIEYYSQLPRLETLKLISSSYYGYTPSPVYNYGFLGDCWGAGTPILLNHNLCGSEDMNVAVAKDDDELVRMINRLYGDPEFFKVLQKVGYDEFYRRSPAVVADKLYEIFVKTLHRSNSQGMLEGQN